MREDASAIVGESCGQGRRRCPKSGTSAANVGFLSGLGAEIVGKSLSSGACAAGVTRRGTREIRAMTTTVIYAFLVVACAPLIGIWRAHAWAKKNGLTIRKEQDEQEQAA